MSIEFENSQTSDQPEQQPIRKSMFQILQDYDNLMQDIEMQDGEVNDITGEQLLINENELESKLRGYKDFLRMLKSKIEFNKEDRKKSTARDEAIKNRMKYMYTFINEAIKRFGSISKTGTMTYKANDYSVYLKKTKVLNTELIHTSDKYKIINFEFNFDKSNINDEIRSLLLKLSSLANGVEEIEFIDKSTLKQDLKLGIYKCSNQDCKAYTTHIYKDCTCDNKPTLIENITPVFR